MSHTDIPRLNELVHSSRYRSTDSKMLAQLREELEQRTVAPAADVPHDVVTMHSRVRILDLDMHRKETFTLVFPEEANLFEHKMSVLAPVAPRSWALEWEKHCASKCPQERAESK
jgi:regulator of nucleoside diphosphate kinase